MSDPFLNIGDHLAGIGLVPAPVQVLSCYPELDDEVARKVLRFDFTPFFPPKPVEGGLIITHYDPGIRAADEIAAFFPQLRGHGFSKSICRG